MSALLLKLSNRPVLRRAQARYSEEGTGAAGTGKALFCRKIRYPVEELKAEMENAQSGWNMSRPPLEDRIRNVERVIQRQAAETNLSERDVLAIKRLEGDAMVQCWRTRCGKLSQSRQFLWEDVDQETD